MTTKFIKLHHAVIASLLPWLAPLATAQDVQAPAEEPLVVQEIRCAGNEKVACDFIRGHLHLSPVPRSTKTRSATPSCDCRRCAISTPWPSTSRRARGAAR